MAYIPPHKRHSNDNNRPAPTPEFLSSRFKKNLNLRSSKSNSDRSGKIVYSDQAISRWITIGLNDNDQFPSWVHLEPVSVDSFERRLGQKPQILVNRCLYNDISTRPWVTIAEHIQRDLLSSFQNLKKEVQNQKSADTKPMLVARFGKILFHGCPVPSLGSVLKNRVEETLLRQLRRSFYTNIPSSYMNYIISDVVPRLKLNFETEKDIYHIKLADNSQPNAILSCKCIAAEDNRLVLYKIEENLLRHMVSDISCLYKNLDLRIMLCTKRILTTLTGDGMDSVEHLVESAVVDPSVKGGLKWPLQKSSSGRFSVIGVWHTLAKSYNIAGFRLKVRDADRYDFKTGIGEATQEISLKLKGVASALEDPRDASESVSEMLEENLRLIWNEFLCCDQFLS